MRNLIHEIHRRSLWQVLGIYLAVSWVVLQVVDVIGSNFGLPGWVAPAALILLLVGLPIVIATAFVQEGMTSKEPEPAPPSAADADEAPPAPPETPRGHRRLLTWRNALVGGGAAFALLGVATAVYLFMRTAGIGPAGTLVAAGVLDERDPILVAELESGSGDESLARTATEALRTDIAESPAVTLVTSDEVSGALARMQRDPDTPLDIALARELATREGIKAVIGGEVNAAGAGYVFTAQVISTADGEVLASRRESAADETEVIDAIDRLSKGIRERLGESLRSVQSSPPLARMTTSSLEALRLYHEGHTLLGRGDAEGGMERLYEAVAIDSTFAAAWRRIATQLGNPGNPPEARRGQVEAATRGYELRDRLTPYERLRAEAEYHRTVTGDIERQIAVYERGIEQFPESAPFFNNLSVFMLTYRQDYERAEELARRGLALGDPATEWFLRGRVMQAFLAQGRLDEAESFARESAPLFPANADMFEVNGPVAIALDRGDWGAARALVDSLGGRGPRRGFRAVRGQLEDVRREDTSFLASIDARETAARYLDNAIDAALREYDLGGTVGPAVERVDQALERYPLETMDVLARPYVPLAELEVARGRIPRARALLDEYERLVMGPLGQVRDAGLHLVRSRLAIAEGRSEEAVAQARRARPPGCPGGCWELAELYDRAGLADSATAIYTRHAEIPFGIGWMGRGGQKVAPVLERLGQLYDEAGDLENAAKYYARFVDVWGEADEELQPRVRAAQARLEEILREIG